MGKAGILMTGIQALKYLKMKTRKKNKIKLTNNKGSRLLNPNQPRPPLACLSLNKIKHLPGFATC